MKRLMTVLIIQVLNLAAAEARTGYECEAKSHRAPVHVVSTDSLGGNPATLTVSLAGEVIYDEFVAIDRYDSASKTKSYETPEFKNANGVPASLYLRVWQEADGIWAGDFAEISFVRVVPITELNCRQWQR